MGSLHYDATESFRLSLNVHCHRSPFFAGATTGTTSFKLISQGGLLRSISLSTYLPRRFGQMAKHFRNKDDGKVHTEETLVDPAALDHIFDIVERLRRSKGFVGPQYDWYGKVGPLRK